MTEAEETCATAFRAISEALSDHWFAYDVGFTCSEAESLYDAMVAVGCLAEADWFMLCHADSDDAEEGDLHYVPERDARGMPKNWARLEEDHE